MNYMRWEYQPQLRSPVLIVAFSGWNDAGDAATNAARYLSNQWQAESFAVIDSEDFYDFSNTRPIVRVNDGVSTELEWPANELSVAMSPPNPGSDVVFLIGPEPQLKWKTFCNTVVDCARQINASAILTLGSLLADVPHTRPAPITAIASSKELFNYLKTEPSQYDGPTGIVGALQQTASQAGIYAASLWVAVPHYVAQTSSPKATLALTERVASIFNTSIDTSGLQTASQNYEQQVTDLTEIDEDLRAYVNQLEEAEDQGHTSGDVLAKEAEAFLRDYEQ